MKVGGYVIAFVAGAILCGALVLLLDGGAGAKLNADLSAARTSLANAVAANGQLAESNRNLQGELAGADSTIADQQRQLTADGKLIAGLKSDLADAKRGLEELSGSVSNGLGDLDSSAKEIASLTRQLFSGYHQGTK